MKSVYALAIALATLLFMQVSAQTPGVYTAVRSGDWNAPIGPNFVWDASGQPPSLCTGCTITINSGFTVNLNTSVTLAAGSTLNIGSGGINAALLLIGNSSGADWASSFNVLMLNDGSSAPSKVQLFNSSSFVNATGAGTYDGILTASSLTLSSAVFQKQVGTPPSVFIGTSIFSSGPVPFGASLTGPITLGSGGVLPILMGQFQAVLDKNEVTLSWSTAQEVNSDHFAIERLNTATSNWDAIGTVAAHGNSARALFYSFTDATPHSGVNEYRIQAVDRDGKYTFSEIKVIHIGALDAKIFPNPTSDFVNVNISNTATGTQFVRLLNQSGQVLTEKRVDNGAGTIVSLPVSSYPQGNYLIIVIGADGSRQVSKLFISHF